MLNVVIAPQSDDAPVARDTGGVVEMRLTAITYGAEGTNLFELRPMNAADVAAFTAGAHVDLHLPNGQIRQYSLANPVNERHRYLLGVKIDLNGRGGSRCLHDEVRVGTVLKVSQPRNNFPLVEDAATSVFVAGGIGITPVHCMIERLKTLGRQWQLHYGVRRREEAIFLDGFAADPRVHLHVDAEHNGRVMDVAGIVAAAPLDAHLYCCGPAPMLTAFETACAERPPQHVHLERFSASENLVATAEGSYTVELRKSKRSLVVQPGQTLLQAIVAAGIKVQVSCEQGICGTCETRVLAGIPDHRDTILSDEEKATNEMMMVCCSGSLSPTLVLDL